MNRDIKQKLQALEEKYGGSEAAREQMMVSNVCWWKWKNGKSTPHDNTIKLMDMLLASASGN